MTEFVKLLFSIFLQCMYVGIESILFSRGNRSTNILYVVYPSLNAITRVQRVLRDWVCVSHSLELDLELLL